MQNVVINKGAVQSFEINNTDKQYDPFYIRKREKTDVLARKKFV